MYAGLLAALLVASPNPVVVPDDYEERIRTWREERFERLRAPDGWTTLTGLSFLEQGVHAIGSAPEADVVVESENAPSRIGVVEVSGDRVVFRPSDVVAATVDGAPVGEVALASDAEDGGPTTVRVGSVSFYLIERGGRLAIRSRDANHPARRDLEPIPQWPVDSDWRLIGRFIPAEPGATIPVPDVLGNVLDQPTPGRVELEIGGETFTIDALDGGDGELFLVFGDRTNREESYGGGRFLYTPPPAEDGTVIVDFNKAYNPPCAFTPWATCPLPSRENRLDVAIRAGEKRAGLPH